MVVITGSIYQSGLVVGVGVGLVGRAGDGRRVARVVGNVPRVQNFGRVYLARGSIETRGSPS